MAYSASTPRQRYAGNGVTTSFAIPFEFREAADLLVLILNNTTGLVTQKTLSTHYTVTGGDSETGNLTMLVAPASGETLIIVDNPGATQTVEIEEGGSFPEGDVEDALDRTAMIARRAKDLAQRSLHASDSDANNVDLELPTAVERANKFLGFDADGNPIASDGGIDSDLPVTAFAETLLQDNNAAEARDTMDAARKTNSLTAETAPATGDSVQIYDLSATEDRKMTLANLLKVVNSLTEHTAPLGADTALVYDSVGALAKKIFLAGLNAGGKRLGAFNIAVMAATTTTAADSIVVQGPSNGSLSATNPAFVNLPGAVDPISTFQMTADVKIALTGAHWGRDTFGDFTSVPLAVYAINDAGTLKWGVCPKPNLRTIASTSTSTTPSSMDAYAKMLVNSALSVATHSCLMVGWIYADFDDTGNAGGENFWTAQNTTGVVAGVPFPAPSGICDFQDGTNGHGSTDTCIREYATTTNDSRAISPATSTTNGSRARILEDGLYAIEAYDSRTGAGEYLGISVNSNQLTSSIVSINVAHRRMICSAGATFVQYVGGVLRLSAGDVVRVHDGGQNDATTLACMRIKKIAHD